MPMLNRLIIASLALVCAAGADAQQRTSTSNRTAAASARTRTTAAAAPATAVPEVVEGPAPTEENAAGMLGGDKPFSLIVDQENGELEFKFNENREVEGVIAKKGVILSSEEMTLNADQLDYDTISSKLVASGQRVVVRQGDVIATCQLFKYDPKTQESELLGSPVVYNKDKNGNVSTTRGQRINIYNGPNGTPQFRVKGGILNTGNGGGGAAPSAGGGSSAAPRSGAIGGLGLGGLSGGQNQAPANRPAAAPASNRIDPANLPADMRASTARSAR